MSKNNIRFKKTYSKIALLLIVVLLFSLAFKILNDGLTINSISVAGVKIDGLYLKLDKKLVLDINNIDLSKMEGEQDSEIPSISDIANIIRRAVTISSLFERLEISNIQYAGESSSVHFDGAKYIINIPNIAAAFSLTNDGDDILLDIELLRIKNELDIKGRILFVDKGNIFAFDLDSYINNREDNMISFQGETNFKYLSVALDSTKLNSIDVLAPYIKILDSDVYEWIYERTKFSEVTINRAYIYLPNLKSKNIEQDVINNLYASGIVDNVELAFEHELSPILSKRVAVVFKNKKLFFYTHNASYEGVIAQNGTASIENFLANQPLLKIDIEASNVLFDERIGGILSYYGVNVPVVQKSGQTSGQVLLDILLPTEGFEVRVTPNGKFITQNANLDVGGMEIFTKKANIEIADTFVYVKDSSAKFQDILDTKVDLIVDTSAQKINIHAIPSRFILSASGLDIVNLTNEQIDGVIDFSKDEIIADFEKFGVHVASKDSTNIYIKNLAQVAQYAPILSYLAIKNGDLSIHTNDFSEINIIANVRDLKYPVYNIDKTPIERLSLELIIKQNSITINESNNRLRAFISLRHGDIDLNLEKMYVNIDEILDSKIPVFASIQDEKTTQDSQTNILINGNDVLLGFFGYDIFLKEAMLKTTKNGFIGNGKNKNGIANIIYNDKIINIEANNFNDEFVNRLFGKEVVIGGTFSLIGIYRDNKFLGDLRALDTSITNMASLQNILTLIDTIPSLIAFKLPGFSASGYEIEQADVRVGYSDGFVALEKINVIGSSVDIEGEGVIDMQTKEINVNLSLSTLKALSSILSKIPLIGYIALGDDGKITTNLTISGNLDDPQTELSLLEDAAKAPINILERIFSPFKTLVNELEKESKSKGMRD